MLSEMLSFLDVTAQDLFSSVPFGCYNDGDEKGKITWVAMRGYIKKNSCHKWLLWCKNISKMQIASP